MFSHLSFFMPIFSIFFNLLSRIFQSVVNLDNLVNLVSLAKCKLSRTTNLSVNFPKVSNLSNILQTPHHSCHQVLLCLHRFTRFFSNFKKLLSLSLITKLSDHQVIWSPSKYGHQAWSTKFGQF